MHLRTRARLLLAPVTALLFCAASLVLPIRVVCADVLPQPAEVPQRLSLEDALGIFRKWGLDLLIAEANTRSAEGGVKIAGAVPNPILSASVGNAFTYSNSAYSQANCRQNGAECSPWIYNLGISDSGAIADSFSGKRALRLKVARNALAVAKMSRRDAERTIAFQVKAAYVDVARALLGYRFAKDMSTSQSTSLKKFQDRYRNGAINEGELERVEVQKLAADQAIDAAAYALRAARVELAFLLGARGNVPDFDVDTTVLGYSVPKALQNAVAVDLLRMAFAHRPDLIGLGYTRQQAEAQLELVNRQRFPDIAVGVNYAWGGYGGVSTNGPLQGPTLTFGLSGPIPVFYALEGERRQAEAQRDVARLEQAKTTAQVVTEVSAGFAAFIAAKKAVERMEGPRREGGGTLESARGAFEIVVAQYEKGAASLTDYLDALRTYIAIKNEYFDDLANYWTAVYQLEAAIARDLR